MEPGTTAAVEVPGRVRCCSRCRAIYRSDYARCPTDGAEIAMHDGDPLIGTTLGEHYVIEACVGEGAMGRVYRAHHLRLARRTFAVKVLLGDLAATLAMRLRFTQEANAAAGLDHPNVVSVVDFGKSEAGLLYLVMDFVEGRMLGDLIALDGAMAPARVVKLARGMAAGLAHAHERGLIHRDFKPDNVILAGEVPRILDFGLAIAADPVEGAARLTSVGVTVGTPVYAAPEQAQTGTIDHRADLFALGVTMYEMLAGLAPFSGNLAEVMFRNATEPAPPIGERAPGVEVPPALEAIVQRLMAKRPEDRYASAAEVVAALDACDLSAPAPPPVAPAPAAPVAGKGRGRGGLGNAITAEMAAVSVEGAPAEVIADAPTAAVADVSLLAPADAAPAPRRGRALAAIALATGALAAAAVVVLQRAHVNRASSPAAAPLGELDAAVAAFAVDAAVEVATVPIDAGVAIDAATAVAIEVEPPSRGSGSGRKPPSSGDRDRPPAGSGGPAGILPPPPPPVDAGVPPVDAAPPRVALAPIDAATPRPVAPVLTTAAVSFDALDVAGALSDATVRRGLTRASAALRRCYRDAAGAAGRSPAVSVKITLTIDEQGSIQNARGTGDGLPGLAACAARALQGERTTAPDVGTVKVTMSIGFRPEAP